MEMDPPVTPLPCLVTWPRCPTRVPGSAARTDTWHAPSRVPLVSQTRGRATANRLSPRVLFRMIQKTRGRKPTVCVCVCVWLCVTVPKLSASSMKSLLMRKHSLIDFCLWCGAIANTISNDLYSHVLMGI